MTHELRKLVFSITLAGAMLSGLSAADWPVWRGPNADGISQEKDWNPNAISNAPVWTKELGVGYSMVAVGDGDLFTMGNQDNQDIIYCLDPMTGAEKWRFSYRCSKGGGYAGPMSTPVIDDRAVYTFSREGHLHCIDRKTGSKIWDVNVIREHGAKNLKWQFAGSPLLINNLVVVNAGESGMAFERKTGKKVWGNGGRGNYATPVAFDGGKKLAIFGEKELFAVDTKSGRRLWSERWETSHDVNAADPLPDDKWIFISSGYGRGCALLDIRRGEPKKLWENKNLSSHFTSPVHIDGHIYGVNGNAGRGELVCLDVRSGDSKWKEKLGFGAFVVAGGRIIFINERGRLIVGELSAGGFRKLAEAEVLGGSGKCWSMPVLANGMLYCRGSSGKMICLDLRK